MLYVHYIMVLSAKFRKLSCGLYYILILSLFVLFVKSISYKLLLSSQMQIQINQTELSNNQIQSDECKKLCPYSSKLTNVTVEFGSSHMIRHFPNFICPQNFRNLADWVYRWPDQFREHVEVTTDQGKQIAPCLPTGSIIYVRQWAMTSFFDKVYPHLQNNFVLVTGESDKSSPTHLQQLDAVDSKIIHWFGQNGQYDVSKSKKFTHLPIGINCYEMADAIQSVYSQQPNHTLPSVFNDVDEPSSYILPQDMSHRALTTNISNKDLVLINFDSANDGTGLRSRVIKNMCSKTDGHRYSFTKCISKRNGVHIYNLPTIYKRNRQYPFWLSPRGAGLDCHRTWEALYLDIIPIVWNSSLNVLYHNLPVLIINDYTDLNEGFLYEKLNEISKKKLSKEKMYEYEKLRNAYWRRLILDKSRHKENRNVHERRYQCWSAKSTVDLLSILKILYQSINYHYGKIYE